MPSRASKPKKRPRDTNQLAWQIVQEATGEVQSKAEEPETRNPAAVALSKLGASKGGKARAKNLSAAKRKSIAKKAATAECRARGGGEGCKYVSLTYHNQCAAMAWGNERAVTQGAETAEIASDLALRECNKLTTDCKIYYTGCSLPARVQ